MPTNPVIETIKNHRSVRKYTSEPITPEIVTELIDCAQMAASSSFFQAYSIIEVCDHAQREVLYQASGEQAWIHQAPLVLLFCADLYRSEQFLPDIDPAVLGYAESLLVATTDTALAAQNLTLAAESQGLGVAFVGGIRNDTDTITAAFELPSLVFPLFLLCIGYPDEKNAIKPRFPSAIIRHKDRYDRAKYAQMLSEYDHQMQRYYATRSSKPSSNNWSRHCARALMKKPRPEVRASLQAQGFLNGAEPESE